MVYKNRNSQNPNRVTIKPENGAAFSAIITRNDNPKAGEEGTPITADVFNEFEDRISKCETFVNNSKQAIETIESAVNNLSVDTIITSSNSLPGVEIISSADNKNKTIKFKLPKPKSGKSYRNKGAWSSTVNYVNDDEFIDTVYLNGATYYCKVSNKNNSPKDNAENTYWGLIATRGGNSNVTIVDNLDSTNSNYALSANQGNIIKNTFAKKENAIYKGTCTTPATTKDKMVECEGFELFAGATIDVNFTNASCSSATLNVNNTGIKSIKYRSNDTTLSNMSGTSYYSVISGGWSAGQTVRFIYNGTYWVEFFNVTLGIDVGKSHAFLADSSTYVKTKKDIPSASTKRYLTFVDSNNTSFLNEYLYTNDGISYDSYNKSLQVENLTDGKDTKSLTSILNTTQLPIGSIFQSAVKLNDNAYHELNGAVLTKTGIYSEFVDWVIEQSKLGNVPVYESDTNTNADDYMTAEEKYNRDIENTGNCGKFIVDEDNQTVRLPRITKFVEGVGNDGDIGNSIEAGLPNITGEITWMTAASTTPGCEGALYFKGKTDGVMSRTVTGFGDYNDVPAIDASLSSKIYGKSTTVQPAATRYPYYIVVANSVKPEVHVNIDNICTDLSYLNEKIDNKLAYTGIFTQNKNYEFNSNSHPRIMVGRREINNDNYNILSVNEGYSFEIITHGRPIVISGNIFGTFENMCNAWLVIDIDGIKTPLFDVCQTTPQSFPFSSIIKGVPNGTHIATFYLYGNNETENQKFTIPNYTNNTFVMYEI